MFTLASLPLTAHIQPTHGRTSTRMADELLTRARATRSQTHPPLPRERYARHTRGNFLSSLSPVPVAARKSAHGCGKRPCPRPMLALARPANGRGSKPLPEVAGSGGGSGRPQRWHAKRRAASCVHAIPGSQSGCNRLRWGRRGRARLGRRRSAWGRGSRGSRGQRYAAGGGGARSRCCGCSRVHVKRGQLAPKRRGRPQ